MYTLQNKDYRRERGTNITKARNRKVVSKQNRKLADMKPQLCDSTQKTRPSSSKTKSQHGTGKSE